MLANIPVIYAILVFYLGMMAFMTLLVIKIITSVGQPVHERKELSRDIKYIKSGY